MPLQKNVILKSLLFERGLTQDVLALQSKVSKTLISMAINGRYKLGDAQEMRICKVLGKAHSEIFPE